MSKKIKSYNLSKDVIKAINDNAIAEGRKNSDWLNRFLTAELVEIEIKPVKVALVKPGPKFNFKSELLALGVNEDVLSDWLKVRAKKKATNTKTALNGLIAEITKSGLMVNDAIEYATKSGWAGFKADWYFKYQPGCEVRQYSKTTEQNINNIGEWLNE